MDSVSHSDTLEFTGERFEALTESLYYNPSTDALIDTAALGSGVTYTINATLSSKKPANETSLMTVAMPKPKWVPDVVGALSTEWAGTDKSPLKRVEEIVSTLQTTGFFSHGLESEEPSNPGHSSYRIAQLLDKPERMIGDGEQYAVAAALLLNDAGIPSRVVMGFRVDAESSFSGSTWRVTGSDVQAWVEVPFEGIGWVPFFPTPDKDQEPKEEDQRSKAKPKPQVLQPPPPSNSSDSDVSQSALDPRDDEEEEEEEPFDWGRILRIALAVTIPIGVLVTPLIIITSIKLSRTKKRRKTPDLTHRVAHGWQEMVDHATDLGIIPPKAATRKQISAALAKAHSVEGVERLAYLANQGTFAPSPPTEKEATEFWKEVEKVSRSLASTFPSRRRFMSKFSLASLRRNPQPTLDIQEWK
ncbi:MAG: transglutaminase-like domain-containing protein [Propionibacteriaceae bacterium]|nr:transglutaminase-like domain-containing protein [Propionibacteriaceae bacterium]